MRGVTLFMIIVAIPLAIALGHDIYLLVSNHDVNALPDTLYKGVYQGNEGQLPLFATFGFIWTQYDPEGYKWAVQNMEASDWETISLFLAQKAVVVTGVFAVAIYFLLGILRLLGTWPFHKSSEKSGSTTGGKGRIDKLMGKEQKGKYQFKRK